MRLGLFVTILLIPTACSCAVKSTLDQPLIQPEPTDDLVVMPLSANMSSEAPPKALEPAGKAIDITDFDSTHIGPEQSKFDERVAAGDKEIIFRINSFGGSIFDGNDFIQHIEDAKKEHGIHTVCMVDTKAMSMGFVFLQSGACDQREMTDRSVLLAHNGSTAVQGNIVSVENDLAMIKAVSKSMGIMCAKRLGLPYEEYEKHVADGHEWTVASDDALTNHMVDKVISERDVPAPYKLDPLKRTCSRCCSAADTNQRSDWRDLQRPSLARGPFSFGLLPGSRGLRPSVRRLPPCLTSI
jgi:ATP-dependent protease ClpP protease subunit